MDVISHNVPQTLAQCAEVLDRLMTWPVLSFFVSYEGLPEEHPTAFFEQNPGFPSLGDICARLTGGDYSAPAQFYWDVWAIFKGFADFFKDDDTPEGRLFRSIASCGTERFIKWCAKAAMTEAEAKLSKLRKAQKLLADAERTPLGGVLATACGLAEGPDFGGASDVPGKIDPIEYYPIE
jgi:hypothetical protein